MDREHDLLEKLERIAVALETIAAAKSGPRGSGGKITINDTGKWKLEGQDSVNGNRFPYENEFNSKEEAIDTAREDKDKYDKIFLISPDGKRRQIDFS
jgi:hypothetical protein